MSINAEVDENRLHRRHELQQNDSSNGYPSPHEVEFSSTTQLDTYFSDEKVIIPVIEKVSTTNR